MVNPARDTVAGRVYNDLRNSARRQRRATDEVMVEYVLERFLYRLATSPAGREHFVLKGGLLLAQFGARRTTRDIDILGQAFAGEDTEIIRRVTTIADTEVDDGVAFDGASLRTAPIRDDGRYHGLRFVMPASIARAQLKLQLDVSVGDPITPGPQFIQYQQLLEAGTFSILGYPLATVIAEKLSTAIELGDLNTRDRDYGDLYRLLRVNVLRGDELSTALEATAAHRRITLRPLSSSISDLPQQRQPSYTAWLQRQGPAAIGYPTSFADTVAVVTAFADPLISGQARDKAWDPANARWT
ncbi:nucleotidyltransferase AbiEii toxin of type IV toxin-antitoxin system [Kribbella sp. VKM Ac-2527]|uniref:Nucleotidyltransferase AbiEii toxin of type IV toxin-antitoxin system n=1 Tax=Kribbella caucasensis TaxID=2512215 RepID=A0A4V3CAN7_9ACTN|nr:nucleotidyl transferase AbiEii/AbiGii toxin family protein [Kribbella sp. VKM Ac-2527]TDO51562.1 nucleotidyltransferase AbiEii toxin of type IV toxin-antitoxin system [Kribbella sp. VKM Ac-2527]